MSGLDEVGGHTGAHLSQADEANIHDHHLYAESERWLSGTRALQNRSSVIPVSLARRIRNVICAHHNVRCRLPAIPTAAARKVLG
jgi:hypothetical protein